MIKKIILFPIILFLLIQLDFLVLTPKSKRWLDKGNLYIKELILSGVQGVIGKDTKLIRAIDRIEQKKGE